jgi:predicted metal-dependent phosphotriesterase family hydrolase
MEKTVMSVTGPISATKLGVTLMHEHFTFAYPGWFAKVFLWTTRVDFLEALHRKIKPINAAGIILYYCSFDWKLRAA